jgi:hypothetical protein
MQRILIGSSNVAGFYATTKFKEYPPFKMHKCTKVKLFKVALEELKEETEIIISVIENFVCDEVRKLQNPTPDQIDKSMEEVVIDFMEDIKKAAKRLPAAKFALAQPILRPAHEWYMDRHDGLCRAYVNGINAINMENVSKLDNLSRMSQSFIEDGIHLTPESGKTFIDMLLYNSDKFFNTEVINLEGGANKEMIHKAGGSKSTSCEEFERSVQDLDKKIEELNGDIFRRRFNDSLVMAQMREDIDVMSNQKKEDKMIISGLTSKVPRPTSTEDRKKWLRDIVAEVLDCIENGISSEIFFVTQGRSNNRDVPLAEVRMKSKETATRLRKKFASLKKSG